MLAPRSDQKSMPTSKGRFCKNYCKTNEILMIFQGYGVEVGIKNQSKIHQKIKPKMDCLLASILVDFGRQVGVEMAPKIDAKTHRKNDANSDAF